MRPEYAAELRSRLRLGADGWVELPPDADLVTAGGTWDRGPIDALVVRREAVPSEILGLVLAVWVMHVAPFGFLALDGWSPGETPAVPYVHPWNTGARLWVPVFYDGFFMIFQNVGLLADT